MKIFTLLSLICLQLIFIPSHSLEAKLPEKFDEISEDARKVAAKGKLESTKDSLVIFAKGLCCMSCAIGARKMISRLDFVDNDRLNNGVELDAKTQLIKIALKKNAKVDRPGIVKAVDKAGYEAIHTYMLNQKGEILVSALPKKD